MMKPVVFGKTRRQRAADKSLWKGHAFTRAADKSLWEGHGFSRAANGHKKTPALSPEGLARKPSLASL